VIGIWFTTAGGDGVELELIAAALLCLGMYVVTVFKLERNDLYILRRINASVPMC